LQILRREPALKLLYDQNLPPQLVKSLEDLYPESKHVRELGLQAATDEEIWERAAAGGFAIVTKDDDFRQRSFLFGAPPKVIWVRLGNCTTTELQTVLREKHKVVADFEQDSTAALLILGRADSTAD
jgi:predicted nuclease of predicted toxin-antitoxin system